MTNATPHSIYSMAPGNPCKLSEINVSFVHFFAADSFRPFILCVLVALPPPFNVCSFRPPFNVCSFRLCCVSLALKMAQKKILLLATIHWERSRDTNTGLEAQDSPDCYLQVSNRYVFNQYTFWYACRKTNLDLSCMSLDLISLANVYLHFSCCTRRMKTDIDLPIDCMKLAAI